MEVVDLEDRWNKEFSSNGNDDNNKPKKIETPITDTDYYEFVINTIKKTVKCEDSLIRQIVLTGLSSKTDDPVNLGVMGPTSEGKTYPVTESMRYFPDQDVMNIGSMSPKVLIRQKGIIINSDTKQSIENELFELNVKIKTEKDERKKEELKQLMNDMKKKSKIMIDLTSKVLIFFEPPHHELWNLLKPILSHDKEEIEFPYVDKDSSNGIETKNVVVRGWPACIFCSARDESSWSVWPEIQSRFLITSPNMVALKYLESNKLIACRKGVPKFIQEKTIVSNKDVETARNCILYIMQKMDEIKSDGISVWIPYGPILGETLPSNRGTDVRNAKRIFSFLNLLPMIKSHLRDTLTCGNETSIIASLQDLHQVLDITQNVDGMPRYKMDFFKNIFVECFKQKQIPDDDDEGKQELIIAVTTRDLKDYHKQKTGKIIDTDRLKKTYLNELHNNGIIGEDDSILDKRQKLYYPIVDIAEADTIPIEKITKLSKRVDFDNLLQQNRILIPKNCINIPENWLFIEILSILKYRIDIDNYYGPLGDKLNEQLVFSNNEGSKLSVKQFMENYENDNNSGYLFRYFTKPKSRNSHSNIFGEMKLLEVAN